MQKSFDALSYGATARAAQNLAGLLLLVSPEIRAQIKQLQGIVTRAHARLEALNRVDFGGASRDAKLRADAAAALNELEAAHQVLLDLTQPGKAVLGRQRLCRSRLLQRI